MFHFELYLGMKPVRDDWTALENHYLKLLRPYAKVNLTHWEEKVHASVKKNPLVGAEKQLLSLKKILHPRACLIACSEEGEMMSSKNFSHFLQQQANLGQSQFGFILGGAFGLKEETKKLCSFCFSFSPMTLPHRLAQVLLLEQLYRSMTLQQGKIYHY